MFFNLIFSKVPKLFTHCMGCFETGLGMLFHLYKGGLLVTHELFEKIEKNSLKVAVFYSSPSSARGPHKLKTAIFELFFSIFSKSSYVTSKPL